jgi:hypothetical protein
MKAELAAEEFVGQGGFSGSAGASFSEPAISGEGESQALGLTGVRAPTFGL